MIIRQELSGDLPTIRRVITDAFATMPYSHHTEVALLDGLRSANALTISLVAIENEIVGHIAFSPVSIQGTSGDWYGVGPLAVRPDRQRHGIGQALMKKGLEQIKRLKAIGCVLVGDPAFYNRFGFKNFTSLHLSGVPDDVLLALSFEKVIPTGEVQFHPAFQS